MGEHRMLGKLTFSTTVRLILEEIQFSQSKYHFFSEINPADQHQMALITFLQLHYDQELC